MSPEADVPIAPPPREPTAQDLHDARVLATLPPWAQLVALAPPPGTRDVADEVVRDLAAVREKALREPEALAAVEAAALATRRPPVPEIDPGVELLIDTPVMTLAGDTLARKGVAQRLVELATAAPLAQPRVVALTGGAGTGKSSVLNMASEILRDHPEVAFVDLDAIGYVSAAELNKALVGELTEFFGKAGVVDTSDSVRDALARYGGIVSDIAKVAGIKVDIGGAVKRSASAVLAEIAEMTQEVGKRLVIVLDHLDRLPMKEFIAVVEALRHYAAIAYVTIVISLDRRGLALRNAVGGELDPALIERLITVELRLPPADPGLLANLVLEGLAGIGRRQERSMDAARALFDLDHPDGGPALALIDSPRDAKRVINALAAELPLAADGEVREVCLDAMLRLLVPELDGPRLDLRVSIEGAERAALLAELEHAVVGHRRAGGARVALRALFATPA